MRYRALTGTGDSTFCSGATAFHVDNAAAVAQAIRTRLLLLTGEWFLDVGEGTPYSTEILGTGTAPTYDTAIRTRILETPGVTELVAYSSDLNRATRGLSVSTTVATIYGQTALDITLSTVTPR
ncbi:hypothetical protein ACW7BJ_16530 [Azospirillum argentinense]